MSIDLSALSIALLAFAGLWYFHKRGYFKKQSSALLYSNIEELKAFQPTFRRGFSWIAAFLYSAGFFLLVLAFIDPHITLDLKEKNPPPVEGRALFLLIDQSGSMGESIGVKETKEGLFKQSKLDRLKEITGPFILGRKGDLLGLVSFARGANVLSPLSLSSNELLEKLKGIQVVTKEDENGTAIGYAIYKTAHLISEFAAASPYKIHQPVMIVLTDGLQDPHPADFGNPYRTMGLEEAATFAKEKGIRLYIVNFEPQITEEKFKPNLNEMERAVKLTGGKLLLVINLDHVAEALKEIDLIEKSAFKSPEYLTQTLQHSYFAYFASLGLVALIAAVALGETLFRRIP